MLQSEQLAKDFLWGLSLLDSYIKLCGKVRLTDIHIISEQFVCQLLNILYGWNLENANRNNGAAPGYDLIDAETQSVLQVTGECNASKVLEGLRNTSKVLSYSGFMKSNPVPRRFRILFLTLDASKIRKSTRLEKLTGADGILFDPLTDILDFAVLANHVAKGMLFADQEEKLRVFMALNPDLFRQNSRQSDRVQQIIDEYTDNFAQRLFLHNYESSNITLQNMYVDPAFLDLTNNTAPSRNMAELLCDYLWPQADNDRERILVIEGDAAIGKTSLVSWLCHHYRSKTETGKGIFLERRIVCIRLRELDWTNSSDAQTMILNYLNIQNMADFKSHYDKAILLLDGADELSMVSGHSIRSVEDFLLEIRQIFRNHKLIVTTRPHFLNLLRFDSTLFKVRRIALAHYDNTMREEWVTKYKSLGAELPDRTEAYIRGLSDQDAVGVADTPLAMYLLARCDMREELRGNQWALFHEIFANAIIRAEYNENFSRRSGALLDLHAAQINYQVVCQIAYRMFQNARQELYYLTSSEIDEVITAADLKGLDREQIRKTCVLCAYWKNADTLGGIGILPQQHSGLLFVRVHLRGDPRLSAGRRGSGRDFLPDPALGRHYKVNMGTDISVYRTSDAI